MSPLLWYLVLTAPVLVMVPLAWRYRHAPRTRLSFGYIAIALVLAVTAPAIAVLTDNGRFNAIFPIGLNALLVHHLAMAQRRAERTQST